MVRTRGNTAARERAKFDMHAAARFQGRPAHVIIIQSSLSSPVSDFKYQMCSSIRVFREDMARMVTYVSARSCADISYAKTTRLSRRAA